MAQNTNLPGGCAAGIVRGFGALLLISGLGNAFSGDVVPGMVVTIIGAIMLFGGSKKGGKSKAARYARQAGHLYREPILKEAQTVSREAADRARAAVQQRNTRPLTGVTANAKSKPAAETRQDCPNPEPHRHYELPRQPVNNAERMIENRKTLYEAGLLTREEYDAELRKLRGR